MYWRVRAADAEVGREVGREEVEEGREERGREEGVVVEEGGMVEEEGCGGGGDMAGLVFWCFGVLGFWVWGFGFGVWCFGVLVFVLDLTKLKEIK